jgi:hypothetical protein
MKKYLLMGFLSLLVIIPCISVAKGAEKDVYLSPMAWTNFAVTLPEGFTLNWEFETYDNPFLASVRIDDPEGYFENLIIGAVSGSGTHLTTKGGKHTITLLNSGSVGGNIRFTYNEPSISGFFPLIIIGIIGLSFLIVKNKKIKIN